MLKYQLSWPDSQVVRRGSAKPLYAGSIPAQASKVQINYTLFTLQPRARGNLALKLPKIMVKWRYVFQIAETSI